MSTQVSSYRLESEIGRGGMGIVYRGVHVFFEEVVAVKVISPVLTRDPELLERFTKEAKLQRQLQHPNIVQVREFLVEQGTYYIVMEFIDGETLETRLNRIRKPMSIEEALNIFSQTLAGFGFAHSQDIIHRDIKPSNIMLTLQGVVKLTDFGIARMMRSGHLTQTPSGTVLGTPAYMSPEQILGKKVSVQGDIYSMGITLYQMLTGRVPFERPKDADSDYPILEAHIHQAPVPPRRLVPSIPASLEGVILKALAKQPEDRFHSCSEFLGALPAVARRKSAVADATTVPSEVRAHLLPEPVAPEPRKERARAARPQEPSGPLGVAPVKPERKTRLLLLTGALVLVTTAWFASYLYRGRVELPGFRGDKAVVDKSPAEPGKSAEPEQVNPAGELEQQLHRAKAAFDRGDFSGAVSAYDKVLALDPSNKDAQDGIDLSRRAQTEAELRSRVQGLLEEGKSAFNRADYSGAATVYRSVLELEPSNKEAREGIKRSQRASVAADLGAQIQRLLDQAKGAMDRRDFSSAISAYEGALQRDPTNPLAHDGLKRARAAKDEVDSAARLQGLLEGGKSAFDRGDFAGAVSAYRDAVSIDSGNMEARMGLERAREALAPQVQQLLAEAMSAFKKGKYQGAISAYSKVLSLDPGNRAASEGIEQARRAEAAEKEALQ